MNRLFKKLFPSKEFKEFRKMHRKHKKELVKLAKETNEWDWLWLHESVIMQIKHMYEFYVSGNNVWQTDDSRNEIIEQLQHILDINAEIKRLEGDDCGLEISVEDGIVEGKRPDDYYEKVLARDKRVTELYEELYKSIGKNILYWWD